jgi:hypothetical protein
MESKMTKSVDKIVKGLEKLATQLQACVIACGETMKLEDHALSQAEIRLNKASAEKMRAIRIRDKIKELIK